METRLDLPFPRRTTYNFVPFSFFFCSDLFSFSFSLSLSRLAFLHLFFLSPPVSPPACRDRFRLESHRRSYTDLRRARDENFESGQDQRKRRSGEVFLSISRKRTSSLKSHRVLEELTTGSSASLFRHYFPLVFSSTRHRPQRSH